MALRTRSASRDVNRLQSHFESSSETEGDSVAVLDAPRGAVPAPHFLEQRVRFELLSRYSFLSLVVRRIPCGICLQGVLIEDDDVNDVEDVVKDVAAVDIVLNQLVVVRA